MKKANKLEENSPTSIFEKNIYLQLKVILTRKNILKNIDNTTNNNINEKVEASYKMEDITNNMVKEEKITHVPSSIQYNLCDKDKTTRWKSKKKIQDIWNQYPSIDDLQQKSNKYQKLLCKNKKYLTIKYIHLNNFFTDYQNHIKNNKDIGTIKQYSKMITLFALLYHRITSFINIHLIII